MNERKHRVLLIAQRLFIKKGFAATSVQDILNESHISKGTFYNYFSSKNECLMTILSHAQEITDARRKELMIGKDPADREIFAKQIAVRMEINREHQLVPLFEAIFHSKDPELRDFIKKHHMVELTWLSRRLVDLYGREAEPYALDGAIMVVGMFKHFINVWVSSLKEEINLFKLINFILCRTDSIILNMIQTKDKLLGDRIYLPDNEVSYDDFCTKEKILERLSFFSDSLEEEQKGKQYVDFLMDEIQSDQPRVHLIETVLQAFGGSFTNTPLEIEAKELAFSISNFMSALQKHPQ
ncbi:putative HTH-type transcriptional regulator YerO [Siminovitchia terrae]|uniref:HTH-type transcriptional regulator YerO n=1 Tax=Siminovitchia terrae TaxID=1914933 RepID=A0A429X7R1_SIMTE|nr:TetR/AcrR family transcriptional regulator [Siminovitchia terrae]RST59350.1 TetR/AcrR family transcriptional regulator [Siminovitchia terrae]GIN92515.1 putative HTH-type transcriptional regulator YerO [Siminovitchia terrae]GIN97444.1 putative HTH-type transcriptional regulator YerO [Siminovitchia terrae]